MRNKLSPLIFVFTGLCILAVSCAKEEGAVLAGMDRPAFNDALILTASAKTAGLFSNMSFDIQTDQKNNEKGGLAYYLGERLDSVVWLLPDIFHQVYAGYRMPIRLEQSFYLPGKYEAKVVAYRDSLVVGRDSVSVNVALTGDFLGINWDSEEEPASRSFDFVSLDKGFTLALFHSISETPYMLVSYKVNEYRGRNKYKEEIAATRSFLYNYMTALYGESIAGYEGEDVAQSTLADEYAARFKNTLNGFVTDSVPYYPLALWETPASHIALIGSAPPTSGEISVSYYKIIAEPVRISM
ncbi:MAG: hypothetical protein LBJ60_02135 [Tannerellaceae bacterium]|jgi:hypothetical protein|nr:hypothetical protein [Tannerellaceae bacterium]